ncbi:MAG TPA: hypothetical protein DCW52_02085 [Gammaproteobacteria bacterium]|jgi:hypothetical protein|nr:hypothetical protein [Gammaproteobacteria bacterium]
MAMDTGKTGWLHEARRRDVVLRSAKVAILVGTILTTINQGNTLFYGVFSADLWWKIPLTFCVPYCVSTYAAVDAILKNR